MELPDTTLQYMYCLVNNYVRQIPYKHLSIKIKYVTIFFDSSSVVHTNHGGSA